MAYIISQLAAGVVASLAVAALFGWTKGVAIVAGGTPDVGPASTPLAALLAEIIASFFLIFAVWGSAADPRAKNVGGFAIGLTIAADILAVGPISGASMNPARSFGPTLIGCMAPGGSILLQHHWIYWVGPIVGGGLAALIYAKFLWPRNA